MQDQYAGDIGDFGKLALLRCLSDGHRLGVCWYKTKYTRKNSNGKHISYLSEPDRFRCLEPAVFDALKQIVRNQPRSIAALERSRLLGDAVFYDDEVLESWSRPSWAETLKRKMSTREFVFLDPDNGIEGSRLSPKHAALSEINALRKNDRVLVVYHHQGRRHARVEAEMLVRKFRETGWSPIELVRFRLFSSRFYVIAGHDPQMSRRIDQFVGKWGNNRIEHFRPVR